MMKKAIGLLVLAVILTGCNKSDQPEVFDYSGFTGKIAFSRDRGRIIILDGDSRSYTVLRSKRKEHISEASVSLSPDGKRIVYSSNSDEGNNIFIMSSEGGNFLKLTNSTSDSAEYFVCPVWSPDTTKIYYVANGSHSSGPVYSITPDGTELKRVSDFHVFRRISVSKDNSIVVFASIREKVDDNQGISLYDIRANSVRKIRHYDNSFTAYSPVLSPDGGSIAYVLRHGPLEEGDPPYYFKILTISLDGTGEKTVADLPFVRYADNTYVTWSPNGTKLAFNYVGNSESSAVSHIYIINSDGSGLMQVSYDDFIDDAPTWSE